MRLPRARVARTPFFVVVDGSCLISPCCRSLRGPWPSQGYLRSATLVSDALTLTATPSFPPGSLCTSSTQGVSPCKCRPGCSGLALPTRPSSISFCSLVPVPLLLCRRCQPARKRTWHKQVPIPFAACAWHKHVLITASRLHRLMSSSFEFVSSSFAIARRRYLRPSCIQLGRVACGLGPSIAPVVRVSS